MHKDIRHSINYNSQTKHVLFDLGPSCLCSKQAGGEGTRSCLPPESVQVESCPDCLGPVDFALFFMVTMSYRGGWKMNLRVEHAAAAKEIGAGFALGGKLNVDTG